LTLTILLKSAAGYTVYGANLYPGLVPCNGPKAISFMAVDGRSTIFWNVFWMFFTK